MLISILVGVSLYVYVTHNLQSQISLPEKKIIFKVEKDEGISEVTKRLEEAGIVRSARLLRLYLSWQKYDTRLSQGEFHFLSPMSIKDVAMQLIQKPDKPLYVVTIPEGSDDTEVADFFVRKNRHVNKDKLLKLIQEKNATGYLFPDTYFLSGKENENQILLKLLINFKTKYLEEYPKEQVTFDSMLTDDEIRRHLSIASLLEGEANTEYDMRVVAGILLKREKLGMKLQVDAAKETYTIKGFPETPINNPGLIALYAAKNPLTTSYLYYITGKDGKMYYAKTFIEHRKNISKYL